MQLMSVDEQVALASDVSVARVTRATPLNGKEVEYQFFVLQRLAGQDRDAFTIRGRPAATGEDKAGTFGNHTDPVFWKRGGGRVMNGSDCRIRPSFAVGATYLVFLDSPWTWRSFERIDVVDGNINERDEWLAYVKAGLDKRTTPAPPDPASPPPG